MVNKKNYLKINFSMVLLPFLIIFDIITSVFYTLLGKEKNE